MTLVAVSYGNSFVVVFCWAWPRSSCCFVALETKRKSGWGICGSSLFVLLWFCVMICHFHRYQPIALCTAFFTAYVVIRTVPQSINGQTRGKKITIPAVHLQKPLALGGQKLLVFGSLLGLPFELSPAALQILHLFMEQCLGPITFQGKHENQRAHVSTLAWWVGGLIDTLNPTRKPVGATSLLVAELVVLSDPTKGAPLSTLPWRFKRFAFLGHR